MIQSTDAERNTSALSSPVSTAVLCPMYRPTVSRHPPWQRNTLGLFIRSINPLSACICLPQSALSSGIGWRREEMHLSSNMTSWNYSSDVGGTAAWSVVKVRKPGAQPPAPPVVAWAPENMVLSMLKSVLYAKCQICPGPQWGAHDVPQTP